MTRNAITKSSPDLVRGILLRYALALPVCALVFFLPAGTWRFWEAWVYMVVLLVPPLFAMVWLLRHEPDLLERRMRMREREPEQRRLVAASSVPLLLAYVLPGFDHRFQWSDVPTVLVLLADLGVLVSYVFIFLVFRENRYAGRTVEVDEGQSVISSGPYAVVRHPMYLGVVLMYVLSPLALGSYWAMLCALPVVWVIAARARNEEEVLVRDLPGYDDYMRRVRYRLVPGIW